jgi:hypothetical protein
MTVPVSPVHAGGMVPSRTKENKMKVTGNIFAIVVFCATVLVGTATAEPRMYLHQQQQQGPTALGLKAWGERLQGEARVYQQQQQHQQQGPTALGLKAWGKRLQAEARVYQQQQQGQQLYSAGGGTRTPVEAMALHFQHEDMIYGGRQQITSAPSPAEMMALHFQHEDALYQHQQQQGPTALGLKAWGERLQGEARVYQQQPPRTVPSSAGHFDWSDAGIGALLGFALAIGFIGALLLGRRFRRTQFATF